MAKILLSCIKERQHALEIFRNFNFLGRNKLILTEDIIIFYPIVPYPKPLYSILSYFILLLDIILKIYFFISVSLASPDSFFKAICQNSSLKQNWFSKF